MVCSKPGLHAFSPDGSPGSWRVSMSPDGRGAYSYNISWQGGGWTKFSRRERPQLLTNSAGDPKMLVTGLEYSPHSPRAKHGGGTQYSFTLVQRTSASLKKTSDDEASRAPLEPSQQRQADLNTAKRGAKSDDHAFIVTAVVDAKPILAFPTNSAWQQVFNPTWVAPSAATGNRSGLLVRSQNCTPTKPGCVGCSGTGQRASWLTWAELSHDTSLPPTVVNSVGVDEAVFGPFDCKDAGKCIDSKGTEDPRLTFDKETQRYYLLYNAYGPGGAFLALASTTEPTKRDGWTRHGKIFGNKTAHKSGSIVLREAGPHYVIWGCDGMLKITPSVIFNNHTRSLIAWNYSASKNLFGVRKVPFWDTIFVESAMPPLKLSNGDLLFFYNSMGGYNSTGGFQPGWVVLSGDDPTTVLARSSVPPMMYSLDWEIGKAPWPCNTPNVANLGGGHPTGAKDEFRLYLGGADAVVGSAIVRVKLVPKASNFSCIHVAGGLSQCLPAAGGGISSNETFGSFGDCEAVCIPKPPPPPPPPMQLGVLYNNTDVDGNRLGSDGASKTWEECKVSCIKATGCDAFVLDNRSSCPEGACCWHKGLPLKPVFSLGRLAMLVRLPPETPGWHGPVHATYFDDVCPDVGCHTFKNSSVVAAAKKLVEALCDETKGCNAFNADASSGGCLRACQASAIIRQNGTGGGCCSYFRIGPQTRTVKTDDQGTFRSPPGVQKFASFNSRGLVDLARSSGVVPVLGRVRQSASNPQFGEDKDWDTSTSYPNIGYDSTGGERKYQLWYNTLLFDNKNHAGAHANASALFPKGRREFGVAYAQSADGLQWVKPDLGLVSYLNSTKNNIICVGCSGIGVMRDAREANASRRYKAVGTWPNMSAHRTTCAFEQGCVNTNDIEESLGNGSSGTLAFSADGLTWSSDDLVSVVTNVSPFGCPGHCIPEVTTKDNTTVGGCNCSFGLGKHSARSHILCALLCIL